MKTIAEAALQAQKTRLIVQVGRATGGVEGSFFSRPLQGVPRYYLARMKAGVQRQVYIPAAQAPALRRATRQHRQLQKLIKALSEVNLALILQKGDGRRETQP